MERIKAEELLLEAQQRNPGEWVEHSRLVAKLAEKIAKAAGMNSEKAYVVGLLHDIGRRNGTMQARHCIEGFHYLTSLGYEEEARICLTHTFQYQNIDAVYDKWDCSEEDKSFVQDYLYSIHYDNYDKLIQLCDALSLNHEYCIAEKKMVDCVFRFGWKDALLDKWRAILELKKHFDAKIKGDVYEFIHNKSNDDIEIQEGESSYQLMIDPRGVWYHGSNEVFEELKEGSTVTQWKGLAEAFSHKPSDLSYDEHMEITHNGVEKGYLYIIDEPIRMDEDMYQHPHTTLTKNAEFLTKRPLKVKRVEELS